MKCNLGKKYQTPYRTVAQRKATELELRDALSKVMMERLVSLEEEEEKPEVALEDEVL